MSADFTYPDDATDEVAEDYEDEVEEAKSTARSSAPRASAAPSSSARDKSLVRRAASKVIQVQNASDSARSLASALLGVDGDDDVDLVVAALTGKSQTQPLGDLVALRAGDDMTAAAQAVDLANDRLMAVWRVIVALGGASSAKPSGAGIQKAVSVAKAARSLDESQIESLDEAVALTRRTA